MPRLQRTLGTWLRHLWLDADDVHRQLDAEAMSRLTQAVAASEAKHSGEIRLCVEGGLPLRPLWHGISPRARASEMFATLGVWNTEANNGVLIYLCLADHAIEIVADRGLSQRVPAEFWRSVVADMSRAFKSGQFEQGVHAAIAAVDAQLSAHFPRALGATDQNELPDAPAVR